MTKSVVVIVFAFMWRCTDCFFSTHLIPYTPKSWIPSQVRVSEEDLDMNTNLKHVADCVHNASPQITSELRKRGYAIIDNFLGEDFANIYRNECEKCYERGEMVLSQSTRWDSSSSSVLIYDKKNVLSTQLNGGEQYDKSPRLHEYIVALIQSIAPAINERFPQAKLNPQLATNKLAVCLGDGSCYDKHFDNGGNDDLRKLTVLLYLNPSWREELGGHFRMYLPDDYEDTENDSKEIRTDMDGFYYRDIEPKHDRLLVFWSDRSVHSVLETKVIQGPEDHRYALTVWILSSDPHAIVNDSKEVKRHFNS